MPRVLRFSFTLILIAAFCVDISAQRRSSRRNAIIEEATLPYIIIPQVKRDSSTNVPIQFECKVAEKVKKIIAKEELPSNNITCDWGKYKFKRLYTTNDSSANKVKPPIEKVVIEEMIVEDEIIEEEQIQEIELQTKTITADEEITWPKPDCRETNPINKSDKAEAYPFISADGLRLYFTSNREGGHGRFFISTRASVKDAFSEPKVLSPHLVDGYYAGTLSADELTMVMVKTGDMYISTRSSVYGDFSAPVAIKGATDQYHFGPSISPDGREIIVMVTVGEVDVIRVYRRTGFNSVEKAGELAFPKGIAGPGQFSKDGLSYYFSLENEEKEVLWKYKRLSKDHPFADLQELPLQLQSLKNNLQPSVNGDESILVFVTSPDEMWDSDDIVLVNNTRSKFNAPDTYKNVFNNQQQSMKVMNKVVGEGLKVYPNPFQKYIQIELLGVPVEGTIFNLYDISGKKVSQQRISSTQTQVPLQNLVAGVYIYQVIDNKGKLMGSGKLIKTN